ncbi:hypothetical protein [Chryseobacterium taiwanense]|uniref:Uncharacterized protein n=1 Tax=Chryseobacterium taiwanense TaxID=363331 RepID=A0A0B4E4V4_9FLAO|nr:hypothetical protein [Chryseobacterium taiwanense]KIC61638.1 hypothetical protein RM51_14630 [Chryseobacterium taiwanense]
MIRSAKNAEILGESLTQVGFNIDNSLGAVLGGIPISMGFDYQSAALVGSFLASFENCFALAFRYFERKILKKVKM